jgi:phage terminase large subunit
MRYWLATPNRFIKGYLQTDLWDLQRQIVDAVFKYPRVSAKSCHASGKTFVAARVGMAFLARYPKSTVVTTAPTWGQVERLLWGEVHQAISQSCYPWPKALTTELRLGPKREMYGLSTSVTKQDEGVKFQGIHNEHVLIIVDEAPGVDPKIQEAIEAALSSGDAHVLKIGNPTIPSGPFFDDFGRNINLTKTFTISAFDTPNLKGLTIEDLLRMEKENPDELGHCVNPYLISRKWVLAQYKKYGPKHLFYQARVLGEFPEQSENSLLSITKLERARGLKQGDEATKDKWTLDGIRDLKDRYHLVGGLDVAGPGEADTVLVFRDGPDIVFKHAIPDADPRGKVMADLNGIGKEHISNINVDSVGIGWGMYCHLNEMGFPCTAVNVGEPAKDTEKFANLKAELYWGLRDRLEEADMGGLDDDQIAQLATIRYEHTPRGQIKIESKEDMVARGVPSPDEAEAVMLAYSNGGLDVWERL